MKYNIWLNHHEDDRKHLHAGVQFYKVIVMWWLMQILNFISFRSLGVYCKCWSAAGPSSEAPWQAAFQLLCNHHNHGSAETTITFPLWNKEQKYTRHQFEMTLWLQQNIFCYKSVGRETAGRARPSVTFSGDVILVRTLREPVAKHHSMAVFPNTGQWGSLREA